MFLLELTRAAQKQRVFLRLLVPYIVFLLLFLSAGWLIYHKTLSLVEQEAMQGNMNVLEQSQEILDQRLADIDNIVQQLLSDPKIMQFQYVTSPFEGSNTYRVLETRNRMVNYAAYNNLILDYFVFFKNSNMAMSSKLSYLLPPFYRQILQVSNNDYNHWNELWFGQYYHKTYLAATEVMLRGNPYSAITYLQSLGLPGHVQGAIAVLIDHKEIKKLLKGIDISDGGGAYIIDAQGRIITSVSSAQGSALPVEFIRLTSGRGVIKPSFDSGNMTITYTTSPYNGWTYVAAQPFHVVIGKVHYIKSIFVVSLIASLGFGVVLAYWLAHRNSRPVKTILNTIMERWDKASHPSGDAYRFIREAIADLIDNNLELQEEVRRQVPLLQAAFIGRLLKGEFTSQKEIDTLSRHVGISLYGRSFAVALLHLRIDRSAIRPDRLEQLAMHRIVVKEIVRRYVNQDALIYDPSEDKLVLLLAIHNDDQGCCSEELERVTALVYNDIHSQLAIYPILAVGGIRQNLAELSHSYEEARQACNYSVWKNRHGIVRYSDMPGENNGYHYPKDMEVRLMHCATAGVYEEVESLLERLYEENFTNRQLSVPMLRLFIQNMRGTVVKMLTESGLDPEKVAGPDFANADQYDTFEEMESSYRGISAAYKRICHHVNDHKKSGNLQLLDNIIRYVHEAYGQADLCLDAAAERTGISREYLSCFFKEQTGVNFSDYLENLRMVQARELLLQSGLSVQEIALQVGYNSLNTFGRAFKRNHGLSATVYRQSANLLNPFS